MSSDSVSIFVWAGVLLILVLVFVVALAVVRKRMNPDEDFHGEGFTLGDLRDLHKSGQLSDEEFEKAKAKLVETAHAAQMQRDAARAEAAKQQRMS